MRITPTMRCRRILSAHKRAVALGLLVLACGSALALTQQAGRAAALTRNARPRTTRSGSSTIPLAARGAIAAGLVRDDGAYRIDGLEASNPAQGLHVRFDRGDLTLSAGVSRVSLSLASRTFSAPPQRDGNRITFRDGPLTEWYANGLLGLEQGFDLARAPAAASGPLTLALTLRSNLTAQLQHGGIALIGHGTSLRYTGLSATDATGHALKSWLGLDRGQILIHVDDAGATYPVHIDPIVQSAELTGSADAYGDKLAGDELGSSVAVSTNGSEIVVGAPDTASSTPGYPDLGNVSVFTEPTNGWGTATPAQAELTGPQTSGSEFGYSVAVSGNGETIVASSPFLNQGYALVFTEPQTGWVSTNDSEAAQLSVAGGDLDFGYSVAISTDDSTIVVGAKNAGSDSGQGAAYVYDAPTGGWAANGGTNTPNATLTVAGAGNAVGSSVAVSSAGDTAVAGAPGADSGAGAVYVFSRPGSGWSGTPAPAGTLTATAAADASQLGYSVGLSGTTIVAGAPESTVGSNADQGAVFAYDEPGSAWASRTQTAEISDGGGGAGQLLGQSVAISGSIVLAGVYGGDGTTTDTSGSVYAFFEPAGGWGAGTPVTTSLRPSGGAGEDPGWSVAVNGSTLAIGAPDATVSSNADQGAAYVFTAPDPIPNITTPVNGATYSQGQVVDASYNCTDPPTDTTLSSCTGTVANGSPIDTSTPGAHTFTVTATDSAGPSNSEMITYTVSGSPNSVPVESRVPSISGTALPGDRITCNPGTWTGVPATFTYRYQWSRNGSAIAGATNSSYTVQITDEAQTLTCTVTASNTAGTGKPATSAKTIVAIKGTLTCPKPSGRQSGTKLGPLSLGLTRKAARKKLKRYQTSHGIDNFCLYGGWDIKAGYASSSLIKSAHARKSLKGRVALLLTPNPYYSLGTAHPGATFSSPAKKLHAGKPVHEGATLWYFTSAGGAEGVLEVKSGVIQEVGLATKALAGNPKARARLAKAFKTA
jgi:FG-GAP repeat